MNALFWGLTLSVIGKVLLVIGVLLAHNQLAHEHKIDAKVIKTFKTERWITILGLLMIVIGYVLEIYFYGFTSMLTCDGEECGAALGALLSQ
jgi:uncharacterized membrane protein